MPLLSEFVSMYQEKEKQFSWQHISRLLAGNCEYMRKRENLTLRKQWLCQWVPTKVCGWKGNILLVEKWDFLRWQLQHVKVPSPSLPCTLSCTEVSVCTDDLNRSLFILPLPDILLSVRQIQGEPSSLQNWID